MNRIANYEELAERLDKWLKDYYYMYSIESFVVGVSGGIDSAVVSTLCAKTGLPTYVLTMPLNSKKENTELSDAHANALCEKYDNVTKYDIDLSEPYDKLISTIGLRTAPEGYTTNKELIANQHVNANTKSRMRMVTLYQIAGVVKGVVVGTGNKVEDYGVGFYTKYGDGGVDISPIADCNKTEVWELGRELKILDDIINAAPTDGLWDDGRTDEGQLGLSYKEIEEAMINENSKNRDKYIQIRKANLHKMEPIPVCKIPN